MNVWHIPFHVIENEWTDDQFFMMVDRLGDRIKRENRNAKGNSASRDGDSESNSTTSRRHVSTSQLIELSKQEG